MPTADIASTLQGSARSRSPPRSRKFHHARKPVRRRNKFGGATGTSIAGETFPASARRHCRGDFAQALIALDADVEIAGPKGSRTLPFARLHRPPGDTPHIETTLAPGELILAFMVPQSPWARRSLYLKIRDRQSYEFALASAAVALDRDGDSVRQVRIALGGVAAKPWRAHAAEQILNGRKINDASLAEAADAAFAQAKPHEHNAFKVRLGKLTLMRAVHQAATMEL